MSDAIALSMFMIVIVGLFLRGARSKAFILAVCAIACPVVVRATLQDDLSLPSLTIIVAGLLGALDLITFRNRPVLHAAIEIGVLVVLLFAAIVSSVGASSSMHDERAAITAIFGWFTATATLMAMLAIAFRLTFRLELIDAGAENIATR